MAEIPHVDTSPGLSNPERTGLNVGGIYRENGEKENCRAQGKSI
jgi:hypothetical protein